MDCSGVGFLGASTGAGSLVAGAASAEAGAGAVPLFDDGVGGGFTVPEGDVGLRAPPDELVVCGAVELVAGGVAFGGGAGCG